MKTNRMLRWSILLGSVVLAPVLMLATTPYAFGCDAGYNASAVQCVPIAQVASTDTETPTPTATATLTATATPTVTDTLTVTPTATPSPTWTATPTPRGDDPTTARIPMWVRPEYCIEAMCPGAVNAPMLNSPGGWDWIAPNSSVWYKMDDGRSLQVQIWVFANGQSGLSLDVFAPEQKDLYGKPIGRGSLNKNYPGADLFYSGRSAAYGIWFARFTNNNPVPISYSLRYTRTTPSLNNVCDSCHVAYPYDWGSCNNGPGSNMCEKLYDYYQTNPQCYSHNVDADMAGGCQ
jgi:hypothetical protein